MSCEQYANDAITNLANPVSELDTTIEVVTEAGFPTLAPFRIIINDEIMLVTGGIGTLTWDVDRAQEETDAQAHEAGDEVVNVLSQGSFDALNECRFNVGTRASRPAPEIEGRLHINTDPGWYIYREDGIDWSAWGPTFQFYETSEENFDWENLDDGINPLIGITDDNNSILVSAPALTVPGECVRLMIQAVDFEAPSTTPYAVTVAFTPLLAPEDQTSAGIVFRESTTSKFIFFRFMHDTTSSITKKDIVMSLDKYTDETTFDANYSVLSASVLLGSVVWFRMEDDGVDLIWSFSNDGKNFMVFDTQSRTDFLASGPDQIGIAVNTNNSSGAAGMNLLSWRKE